MPRTADHPYRFGVLLGDGIGPEVVPAAVAVVDAAALATGVPIAWEPLPFGRTAIDEVGEAMPARTLDALASLDGWLAGPHDSASYPEPHRSRLNPSGTIRKHFALFANIRPARSFPGVGRALVPGIDLVIVRENTEGFYADRNTFAGDGELMPTPDVAIAHGIVTRAGTERIAHVAFRLARSRSRSKRVTIVHKANVLRLTMGLFRDVAREVGAQYPDVAIDELHIDAATVHLLRRPDTFDVILTENMFGDILSDLTGEIAGSLGTAPSINSSATHAMAQAAHGSAPDIAGQDIANPIAMILSSAMLLRWLATKADDGGLARAATIIEHAVEATVAEGVTTPDLGGTTTTTALAAAVVATIGRAGAGAGG